MFEQIKKDLKGLSRQDRDELARQNLIARIILLLFWKEKK